MPFEQKKIGEILLDEGLVSSEQLDVALKKGGGRVGNNLIALGYVTEEDIARALAHQHKLSYAELGDAVIDPSLISLIPESLARKYRAIPLSIGGDTLTVAVTDPLNILIVDEFQRRTDKRIKLVVSTESAILKCIASHYVAAKGIEDVIKDEDLGSLELVGAELEVKGKLERIADNVSIVRLVDQIIYDALEGGVSDIHIEPDSDLLRVRFRIDGILRDAANLPVKVHPAVISRLKILSNMDIAEKRHPQDGRFVNSVGSREVDVRVSTLPTIFGEKVVMRLLDKSGKILDLDEITPCKESASLLKSLVKNPYGMILVTGPTGSGKTTTLYSLLTLLDSIENNIITVEDPVEYQFKRINQVQVNPKADINFADVLRHVLRQDPDIIMVGEIRDSETAEIATNAALTGHLVLSTLHTNRIAGSIARLIDMGVEPFLITSSLIGIATQRLVRKICPDCKVSYKVDDSVLAEFNLPSGTLFYRGEGCRSCKGEGYRGRLALIEAVKMGPEIRKLAMEKADSSMINMKLKELGIPSLRTEGIKAVVAGLITVEEVIRVTLDIDDM